jgi:uncharacterized protein
MIMAQIRCSVCERAFDPEQSRSLPFCSERCRLLDLGRWLNEDYGLPYETEEDEGTGRAEADEEEE